MSVFLLTFFLVYGSFHLYAFIRAKRALDFGGKAGLIIAVFMIIMILAPLIVRLSEKAGLEVFARFLSFVGYTWLGIIFLFVSFASMIDLFRFLVYLGGVISGRPIPFLRISDTVAFVLPLSVSLVIAVTGYFSALDIQIEKRVLKTDKLPPGMEKLTIVQISDVHLGLIVREGRLKRILARVKEADPDIMVSTGDLVDGQIDNLNGLSDMLNEINPPLGKFAITGNHEFYAGLSQALKFTRESGFTMLRDKGLALKDIINIAGVDDPAGSYFGQKSSVSEKEMLSSLPKGKFTLLLKHRPLIDKSSLGLLTFSSPDTRIKDRYSLSILSPGSITLFMPDVSILSTAAISM